MSNLVGMRRAANARLHATLLPQADSVRQARELIRTLYARVAVPADPDTALLLVSELVSNAILHARSTIRLTVIGTRKRLRVEVTDASARLPLAHYYSPNATTGRGLHLVDRLSDAWGFDPLGSAGKTVWFELAAAGSQRPATESTTPERASPADAAARRPPQLSRASGAAGRQSVVQLLRLPIELEARAAEHHDGLVRELMLLATPPDQLQDAPGRLARMVHQIDGPFISSDEWGRARLSRARSEGRQEIDLEVDATPESARATVRLSELLTEADDLCRAGGLLTLAARDDVVSFRDWYVDEVVGQLIGSAPTPWPGPW